MTKDIKGCQILRCVNFVPSGIETTVGAVMHFFGYIVLVFILCYSGQRMMQETAAIRDFLYALEWYQCEPELIRDLKFILARCQIPIVIEALPLGTLNYEFFLVFKLTKVEKYLLKRPKISQIMKRVTLPFGVPGHKGVEDNEEADTLVRKGSATTLIGPEPMCGIPKSSVRLWMTRWKNKEHQSYWNHIPGQTNSKWMVKTPSKVLTDEILRWSRNQIRFVTGLITGHCHLRKYLHRMGIYLDEPICRLCNEEDETSRHIILECPALTHWRYGLLGIENPQEAFPKKNLVKGLLHLIKTRIPLKSFLPCPLALGVDFGVSPKKLL
ncbi:hypothetical protein NQ318_012428 [Aromia moschata]|uniref:Reverse transcriptase zinc-binding domain-containing protein n=1 Tax=Aromia moschata TaxID=1265417 RepID=A0AAV8XKR8_9CUCU|nr:hypothetical protein NQ318_012428 [Aromia moschata]